MLALHGQTVGKTSQRIIAYGKSKNQQRRVVYSVTSGAPAGTYLIVSAMPSLKSMDPDPARMSMPDAFGADNLARYQKLLADIVVSSENALFSVNPRMSYAPKDFITADPHFWAPKPALAKPAEPAKPTGAQ